MNDQQIRDLFAKHNADLARDDVWSVQGALVVKHKALERLAAALKIRFQAPQILRAERDEAVILATGRCGDAEEWSIGEALATDGTKPGNYRVAGKMAPYVYAMAEKRAKDRVILKLAGLHGAYSEDEADDFKQAPAPARQETPRRQIPEVGGPSKLYEELEDAITNAESMEALNGILKARDEDIHSLPEVDQASLRRVYAVKREALRVFA